MTFTIIPIVLINFVLCVNVMATLKSWEVNQKFKSEVHFGDMLLTPLQKLRYRGETLPIRGVSRKESSFNRWPDNTIPYELSPQYTEKQKQKVRTSLTSLENVSCFRFTERRDERDYLFIVPLDGCYSFVGKIGGRQKMSLAVDCLADYIVWHEVMHAIGFEHEHQRPDRDAFIHVEYNHVQPGQLVNFEKISSSEVDYPDSYDYKSIMHYDSFAFGKKDPKTMMKLATMIPLKKGVSLDDNIRLTKTDILKLNRLGNCNKHNSSHHLPVTNKVNKKDCTDIGKNCNRMKEKGLCTMAFYKLSMQKQCALTCDLCDVRGAEIIDNMGKMEEMEVGDLHRTNLEEKKNESGELSETSCVDMVSTNITFFKELPKSFIFLHYCRPRSYRLLCINHLIFPPFCDLHLMTNFFSAHSLQDPNCSTYLRNGFCTYDFYKSIRKERCARTCSLC